MITFRICKMSNWGHFQGQGPINLKNLQMPKYLIDKMLTNY